MLKIKLEELILVARKEKEYLNLLISQVENILNNNTAFEIPDSENLILHQSLHDLKLFYDTLSASWSGIFKEYTVFTTKTANLKDSKRFSEFISAMQLKIKKSRLDFVEKHNIFINELDQSFKRNLASEVHPMIYQALSSAYMHLHDTENANNGKLHSLTDVLNFNYQPISSKIHEIDPYNNLTLKPPLYPLIQQNTWKTYQRDFLIRFNNKLLDFLTVIKYKFEFFYQRKTFTHHCNEIYQITVKPQKYVNAASEEDFLQPTTDFLYVLNFIKNNADFFYAAFDKPDDFQLWANKNISLVSPISKVLKENLKYSDQIAAFFNALKDYLDNNKDGLLCRFLLHKTNMLTFVTDLKMLLIEGMYLEKNPTKSPRYTMLTLSLEKVCEKWRKDLAIYDFNKKFSFLFWASRHDESSSVYKQLDNDCMHHLHQSFVKRV